ncbi:MAG: hypothetical protein M1814_000686 [Vezdaea aestivalis]|nr:MAG: hypothetical protein M1814_000686 [Vezdaea aestivalis]
MPSRIQLDENLWFLYICLTKSDYKNIDFHAVAEITKLNSPAARMRFTRLKRQIESGTLIGTHGVPFAGRAEGAAWQNNDESAQEPDPVRELSPSRPRKIQQAVPRRRRRGKTDSDGITSEETEAPAPKRRQLPRRSKAATSRPPMESAALDDIGEEIAEGDHHDTSDSEDYALITAAATRCKVSTAVHSTRIRKAACMTKVTRVDESQSDPSINQLKIESTASLECDPDAELAGASGARINPISVHPHKDAAFPKLEVKPEHEDLDIGLAPDYHSDGEDRSLMNFVKTESHPAMDTVTAALASIEKDMNSEVGTKKNDEDEEMEASVNNSLAITGNASIKPES